MKNDEILVAKIGSESLENILENKKVERLIRDIVYLTDHGVKVILVSSGAVSLGQKILPHVASKKVLAAVGQAQLITGYQAISGKFQRLAGQILVTHADIEDFDVKFASLKQTIEEHWAEGIIPIINENDPLCGEELEALRRGADNDQNALLLAKRFGAQTLAIVTNTNGVYSDRNNPDSNLAYIDFKDLTDEFIDKICGKKSDKGTGGIDSKLRVAREGAKSGINIHILDGMTSFLSDHFEGKNKGGTVILGARHDMKIALPHFSV